MKRFDFVTMTPPNNYTSTILLSLASFKQSNVNDSFEFPLDAMSPGRSNLLAPAFLSFRINGVTAQVE